MGLQKNIEMKKCIKCNNDKINDEFVVRKNGHLNSWCKECVREGARKSYRENRLKCIKRGTDKNLKFRQHIYNYLKKHTCIDCGESNPIVLQFDHRDMIDKKYTISNMKFMSIDVVDEEIKKCDVRCANCHLKRTAKQLNWYKFLN